MTKFEICLIFAIASTSWLYPCMTENILIFLPISSKSVKNAYIPIITELALRGHNITVVSSLRSLPPGYKNVTEIVPYPSEKMFSNLANPFELRSLPPMKRMMALSPNLMSFCEIIYNHPEIQELAQSPKKGRFDLVIVNAVGNHCFYGLIQEFHTPIVALLTFSPVNFVTERLAGLHLPYSWIPFTFLGFTDKMSFLERVENVVIQLITRISSALIHRPKLNAFKDLHHDGESSPSVEEIEKNFSLLLTNTHFSLNSKLPLTPDVIEVGGMHCRPAQKIEIGDLQNWLDESRSGFIYFSLGSIIQGHAMPDEYRTMFVNVFKNLSLNVLWKWEGGLERFGKLPNNIRLENWMPQQNVLGHPNAKLFISHGGLLSMQEAVYHAVPVLGFPFFLDQDQNLAYIQQNGVGLKLEILEMTEEILLKNINNMLKDESFASNAAKLSRIFRDQPQSPLDRAIFWIEYTLRHKGATHLRSSSRNLTPFQYHSYDVAVFIFAVILAALYVFMKIVLLLRNLCCKFKLQKIKEE